MSNLPKVIVGHAMYRTNLTPNFYLGMVNTFMSYPGELGIMLKQDLSVAWAKNLIVEGFLQSDAQYLFIVDIDVGVPIGGLKKLVEADKKVIGGLVWYRRPPFEAQMKQIGKDGDYSPIYEYPEGVIEVDAIGGGCTLWHRSVFEENRDEKNGWFSESDIGKSEDIYFEEKLRLKGIKLYADTTVKCTHMSERLLTEEDFKIEYDKFRT